MVGSKVWKPMEYHIAVTDLNNDQTLRKPVKGEIKGFFGIHGTPFNYTITHLPTGYALNKIIPEGMKRTKKNLRVVVDKISELDWNFTDPKQSIPLKHAAKKLVNKIKPGELK